MKNWQELTHWAGLDWASDHHDVVIVDQHGTIAAQFRFEHSAAGWQEFRQYIAAYPALGVAIETRSGAAVEELLQSACAVFPVQPRAAARYRERKAPSGAKDDQLDAWALADALRLDGQTWRPLAPEDPLVQELRLLCRDEVALIEQRTALVNQIRAALREYYDTALQAFEDWTAPASWAFLIAFPTPAQLLAAGPRCWEKFLHTHKLWRRQTAQKRLELFAQAAQWKRNEAVTRAKSRLAVSLAKTLQTLQRQLQEYRAAIEALFHKHPDADLFGSLPGAGSKLAPRLLSEIGEDRHRFQTVQVLQMLAGTAPVSYTSGQIHIVKVRRACSAPLRRAVHLWAACSLPVCAWAQAYYQSHRQKGKSHACALRCLGQRWLEILFRMWQNRSRYDGELHARNQKKHGSWIIKILPPTPAPVL
jgi:transposase